jgi:hypothetical protein
MSTERREHVQVVNDEGYERQQRVVEYAPPLQQVLVSRISQLMWLMGALIIGIIVFRFIFLLIAANAANAFVDLIYDITDILVAPFMGIVNSPVFDNGARIDLDSLFAIIVYALGTWLLVTVFRLIFADSQHVRKVSTIERER